MNSPLMIVGDFICGEINRADERVFFGWKPHTIRAVPHREKTLERRVDMY